MRGAVTQADPAYGWTESNGGYVKPLRKRGSASEFSNETLMIKLFFESF